MIVDICVTDKVAPTDVKIFRLVEETYARRLPLIVIRRRSIDVVDAYITVFGELLEFILGISLAQAFVA